MEKINKERAVKTLFELLKIKSPTKNEREIVGFVSKILKGLNLEVYVDGCGKEFGSNAGNIIAYYKNPAGAGKPIFLNAHLDTVSLNGEVIPVLFGERIINKNKDCILGGDDKVAVAAIIEALRIIIENKISASDLYIIFTISEEGGIFGAKCLDMEAIEADYGFAFDSDGDVGTIINKAPYQNSFYIDFQGRAAHAGIEPEKGINAINMAADFISGLKTGRIDKETTSNIGIIEGGTARNVVPQHARIELEARSLEIGKLEKISKIFHDKAKKVERQHNGSVTFKMTREFDGFQLDEKDIPFKAAKNAIEKLGITPRVLASGGGSDVNIFNAKNKKAINLSAGMEKVHTPEEYIKLDQFMMLINLVLEICKYRIED